MAKHDLSIIVLSQFDTYLSGNVKMFQICDKEV